MRKIILSIVVSCLVTFSGFLIFVGEADALPINEQVYYNDSNGHFYTWIETRLLWADANIFAQNYSRTYNGINLSDWYLATITDVGENLFVFQSVLDNGDYQDLHVESESFLGSIARNSDFNFEWVTGEPFVYTNFAPGQPSHARENVLEMGGIFGSRWNDEDGFGSPNVIRQAFILEHNAAVPEPCTIVLFGLGGLAMASIKRRKE